MRPAIDTSPGAYAVKVQCLACGRMVTLAATTMDLDGPSFRAYYCRVLPGFSDRDCWPREEPQHAADHHD